MCHPVSCNPRIRPGRHPGSHFSATIWNGMGTPTRIKKFHQPPATPARGCGRPAGRCRPVPPSPSPPIARRRPPPPTAPVLGRFPTAPCRRRCSTNVRHRHGRRHTRPPGQPAVDRAQPARRPPPARPPARLPARGGRPAKPPPPPSAGGRGRCAHPPPPRDGAPTGSHRGGGGPRGGRARVSAVAVGCAHSAPRWVRPRWGGGAGRAGPPTCRPLFVALSSPPYPSRPLPLPP